MESVATSLLNGNMDWMSLAGKMLSSLKERPLKGAKRELKKRKTTVNEQIPPVPKPRTSRKPTTQLGVHQSAFPSSKTSFAETVSQFEALRTQLLRQLVIYQKQLMALKIPFVPGQFKTQQCVSNVNYHRGLNGQLAAQYKNNRVIKGDKWMTVAENTPNMNNTNTKLKKTTKRKSKSKKASHNRYKTNKISNPAEEINVCSAGELFTGEILPDNIHFPIDKSGFNDMCVPTQCTTDKNVTCHRCLNNRSKTCKNKMAPKKKSTKNGNSSHPKKGNQNVVKNTCVSEDS